MKRAVTHRTPPGIAVVPSNAQFSATCPACGVAISTQATVAAFGEPADWIFWGRTGERWRRCEGVSGGYTFVHFRILFDGRFNERLAWIQKETTIEADQLSLWRQAS